MHINTKPLGPTVEAATLGAPSFCGMTLNYKPEPTIVPTNFKITQGRLFTCPNMCRQLVRRYEVGSSGAVWCTWWIIAGRCSGHCISTSGEDSPHRKGHLGTWEAGRAMNYQKSPKATCKPNPVCKALAYEDDRVVSLFASGGETNLERPSRARRRQGHSQTEVRRSFCCIAWFGPRCPCEAAAAEEQSMEKAGRPPSDRYRKRCPGRVYGHNKTLGDSLHAAVAPRRCQNPQYYSQPLPPSNRCRCFALVK